MTNEIPERVAEFVGQFPPFHLLEPADLIRLISKTEIRFKAAGEILFKENEQPENFFFMVRKGKVKIYLAQEGNRLIDECDEGDIFGVRPLIAKEPYLASAQVEEDALLYALPVHIFEQLLEKNPKLALYFAAGFASGRPAARKNFLQTSGGQVFEHSHLKKFTQLKETTTITFSDAPVVCNIYHSIREAAEKMTLAGSSSIVVVSENQSPIGIITDTDFRAKVATGAYKIDKSVTDIMSSPVFTISPHTTNGEAMVHMMQQGIHHLCITEGGSPEDRLLGTLSDEQLLVMEGRSPAALLRGIKKATSATEIKYLLNFADSLVEGYVEAQVNPPYISGVMTALNDAVIGRCLELAQFEMGQMAAVDFCWLSLGSEGRGEQIIRTDQDNALVYADPHTGQEEEVKTYFLTLAQRANEMLAEAGFEYDPAGIMAGNHQWCMSYTSWCQTFEHWIQQPDQDNILLSTIFFDFRGVYGNLSLATQLSLRLHEMLKVQTKFLSFMAKDALSNPPPLSFFRNFVVEKSGSHKDEFDLKLRAMLPLVDAARVLALQHALVGINNTPERFRSVAQKESSSAEIMHEAAMAFEILQGFRARFAIADGSSGRYIQPEKLNKIHRQTLRNVFSIISEIQQLLEVRFQTAYIRA